jgi:hypothetical protein
MKFTQILAMALLGSMSPACAAQVDGPREGDESGDLESSVELGSASQAVIGPNDVGVIPAAGTNCPNEWVMLHAENEREGNWNDKGGWIGATDQQKGHTKFNVCRVDGSAFRNARGTASNLNYAVVKLGATCPAGSVEFTRYFDNEDRPRSCPPWPIACGVGKPDTLGDFAPSYYSSNNLWMKFCMFRASASGSTSPAPNLGFSYGVFGTPSQFGALADGFVHTDDEDDGNANRLQGDHSGSSAFLTAGGNTTLKIVRVR